MQIDFINFKKIYSVTNRLTKTDTELINEIKNELDKNDHSLIILVGSQIEKSSLIKKLEQLDSFETINLNYHLSRILSGVSKNDLPDPVELIEKLLEHKTPIFFNHNNILFDSNLQWSPLDIFKKLSRNRMVVVFWDGQLGDRTLKYAQAGHDESSEFQLPETNEILIM